jgi:uroporphyrinogen-III decarboxylase
VERILEATRTCIETLAPLRGYIVQDGANIPPDTPPEHVNAMMQAAETWGRYG